MGWFEKRRSESAGLAVQVRDTGKQPFGALDRYVPASGGELALYRSIREAVPIVDAAIWKLIRLVGGVEVICDRKEAIAYAIDHGQPGDIIVLAGKGHEDYQEINGVRHHFLDREVIEETVKELGEKA